MITPERPLFIPLKSVWFDAFAAGTKTAELRPYGQRWNERTCRIGRAVTLSKGYGARHRITGTVAAFETCHIYSLKPAEYEAFRLCYGYRHTTVARITITTQKETK